MGREQGMKNRWKEKLNKTEKGGTRSTTMSGEYMAMILFHFSTKGYMMRSLFSLSWCTPDDLKERSRTKMKRYDHALNPRPKKWPLSSE